LELALGHSDRIQAIAWRKDGGALATASRDGSAILWNPRTGMPWATFPLESSWRTDVSWSPDGNTVATLDASGQSRFRVTLWDAKTGSQRATLAGAPQDTMRLAWRPDGRALAVLGRDEETVSVWNIANLKDGARATASLPHLSYFTFFLAWSSDGTRLAVAG